MKQKELIQLVVGVVVLLCAGYFIFTAVAPHKKGAKKQTTYEVVTKIEADYNADALQELGTSTIARDFYTKPDLHSGLGNPQPFNPLR